LSKEDKEDMVSGVLTDEQLVTGVEVWRDTGMPECTNGSGKLYRASDELPMQRYRGMGKSC
jgi:hypothetical protein